MDNSKGWLAMMTTGKNNCKEIFVTPQVNSLYNTLQQRLNARTSSNVYSFFFFSLHLHPTGLHCMYGVLYILQRLTSVSLLSFRFPWFLPFMFCNQRQILKSICVILCQKLADVEKGVERERNEIKRHVEEEMRTV